MCRQNIPDNDDGFILSSPGANTWWKTVVLSVSFHALFSSVSQRNIKSRDPSSASDEEEEGGETGSWEDMLSSHDLRSSFLILRKRLILTSYFGLQ